MKSAESSVSSFCKWVGNHTVTSLEANLGLEGILSNGTNHLKGNVWAVEQSSVIRRSTLITDNVILITGSSVTGSQVSSIRIDVYTILTLQNTSEGVTGVINVQVSVQSRGVVKYTSHGESRSNVSGAKDRVALSSTSSLCNRVGVSFDLEQQSLELLNTPASVGVDVEIELTSGSGVLNSTLLSNLVDSTDNFAVDLEKNLSGENVGEFNRRLNRGLLSDPVPVPGNTHLRARDLAVTVTFSMLNAISLKAFPVVPSPSASALAVVMPCPAL